LTKFHIQGEINLDNFKDRVQDLGSGKWFIPKFIDFQYGQLDASNRVHMSVLAILKKEGANKDLTSPLLGAMDMDKDKDKDKDKERLRENKVKDIIDPLPDWLPPTVWDGFREARKKLKKPMTAGAEKLLIAKLAGMKERGHDPVAVVEESVMRGWQGLFEPKDPPKKPTPKGPPPPITYVDSAEADEIGAEKDFCDTHLKGGVCSFCGKKAQNFPGTKIYEPCNCKGFSEGLKKIEEGKCLTKR
jgi:hypothetical protein